MKVMCLVFGRVRPWVDRALEASHHLGLIPRSEFDVCVIEGDTRCSMEHGLITAVDLMGRCCPHVFIGPTCELSLCESTILQDIAYELKNDTKIGDIYLLQICK